MLDYGAVKRKVRSLDLQKFCNFISPAGIMIPYSRFGNH